MMKDSISTYQLRDKLHVEHGVGFDIVNDL